MAWSKTSRIERGYGPEWDKTRKRILARDCNVCQPCKAKGIVHLGSEVDHITSKAKARKLGWADEQIEADSNLQCINRECHKRKTQEEKGCRPRPAIGPDGWPERE
ncbi:MAG TPA: HNH endonuclease [Noviherbaspirillum sp.]|nr:HNH endonuclease [Noviherbaspirillum sp.]